MELEVEVTCPRCKRKFIQRVVEMVPGRTRRCPSCSASIRFAGDDGREAQAAVDGFTKAVRDLGRALG